MIKLIRVISNKSFFFIFPKSAITLKRFKRCLSEVNLPAEISDSFIGEESRSKMFVRGVDVIVLIGLLYTFRLFHNTQVLILMVRDI
ncbi:hypothetical protein EUTSA_v10002138mg [Eutrema salsugineum]|uniref:Uncharacterized protein n=1 Tax=Eutrema salsugineum TaxID=72664 RepID=V4LHS1_EUTSA|nr:hypothetical protein EUTSA_v10002138mg [Eutrema salsugineum]